MPAAGCCCLGGLPRRPRISGRWPRGEGRGKEGSGGRSESGQAATGKLPPLRGIRAGEGGRRSCEGRGLNPNCRRPAPDRHRPPSCFFVSASARSALTGGSGGGSRPRAPHVTGRARQPPPGGATAAARQEPCWSWRAGAAPRPPGRPRPLLTPPPLPLLSLCRLPPAATRRVCPQLTATCHQALSRQRRPPRGSPHG